MFDNYSQDCNDPVGYSRFTQQAKFNSRMYLKHDVAYVSVMIRGKDFVIKF